jgi:hypothetical protein
MALLNLFLLCIILMVFVYLTSTLVLNSLQIWVVLVSNVLPIATKS